jgi:1,4-dihydroxy-6-naphthoate synthase
MSTTIKIGFSPCPNDTFIFDALVNGQIDTEGINFEPVLEDVQTLNEWAFKEKLAISKISYGVYPLVKNKYHLLNSGGALGKGVGPLLVTKTHMQNLSFDLLQEKIQNMLIAIPGKNTTAHFLFSLAFPLAKQKQFIVFNEVENAVVNEQVNAGVIIHENRFTYQDKGLNLLLDLGAFWEDTTQLPIPLGGIVAHNSIDERTRIKIDKLIRKSLAIAFENYPYISNYVRQHAQEMDEQVMRNHIDLYVNDFSLDLGEKGKLAVEKMMEIFSRINHK